MTEFKHLINAENSGEKPLVRNATVVIPCLNEALNLGAMLVDLKTTLSQDREHRWTILVVDNNSTDESAAIARQCGVDVVSCTTSGYGAALQLGLNAARTPWVVFLDGDGTYLAADVIRVLHLCESSQLDIVVGSRTKGNIESGAMPFLHRYIGTPFLTFLINYFFKKNFSDVNSGLRCVYLPSYRKWKCGVQGMAFASELLMKACQHHARMGEVPIQYKKSRCPRASHLRPIWDGVAHLGLILQYGFFRFLGRPF